jgi:uncharacterized membrane protein YfcA
MGMHLVRRMPEQVFQRVLLGTLLVTGLKLCWDAVVG